MSNIWVIAVKEWRHFFVSVRAYIFGAMFLFLGGWFGFAWPMLRFNELCLRASGFMGQPRYEYMTEYLNVNDMVVRSFLGFVGVVFLFIVPAATMHLFAEERRAGTDELLFTAPVSDWQLVAGKYLGGLLAVLTPLALTLSYTGFLAMHSAPDWGPVWTGYAGLAFMAAAFVALGLAASAATRSQIVAMVLTFGILLVFYLIGEVAKMSSYETGQLLRTLSLMEHFENFSKGVVEVRDIVYFLSVAAFGLVLTHQLVAARRWKG